MGPAAERVDMYFENAAVPAQQADLINKSFAQLAQPCAERFALQSQGGLPHASERISELVRFEFAARLGHREALHTRWRGIFGASGTREAGRRREGGDGERPSSKTSGGRHAPLPAAYSAESHERAMNDRRRRVQPPEARQASRVFL